METIETLRTISIIILIIALPLFFYFLAKILYSKKIVKIHAEWEDINKHIKLDDLEKKTNSWRKKGYDVSELKILIEHARKK